MSRGFGTRMLAGVGFGVLAGLAARVVAGFGALAGLAARALAGLAARVPVVPAAGLRGPVASAALGALCLALRPNQARKAFSIPRHRLNMGRP